MKTRLGFVSNSSSCSFTIGVDKLTGLQVAKIFNIEEEAELLGLEYPNWAKSWQISINKEKNAISFYTSMDNFDMLEFLEKIGVPENAIENLQDY